MIFFIQSQDTENRAGNRDVWSPDLNKTVEEPPKPSPHCRTHYKDWGS